MGRPRLYATSVERKAAWRRRQGMAVRPHYPSAAAKQAAYRVRKQAAQALAARECAAIQQALRTRALADQSWERYELIDTCSRDADMPRRVPAGRPPALLAGASECFSGMTAARVRRHRRALQRLAHIRATRGAQAGVRRGRSPGRRTCALDLSAVSCNGAQTVRVNWSCGLCHLLPHMAWFSPASVFFDGLRPAFFSPVFCRLSRDL